VQTVALTEFRTLQQALPMEVVSAAVERFPHAFEMRTEGGCIRLRPTHFIGSVAIGDYHLLVQPKVQDLRSVFFLLERAYHLDLDNRDAVDHEEAADLCQYLVRVLVRQLQHIVRHGVRRGYVEREEDLAVMRGRFDGEAQFRRNLGRPELVACIHDEFTADLLEHHLIAMTLEGLLAARFWPPDLRRQLSVLLAEFTFGPRPPLTVRDFERVRFDRLNRHYETPLGICRLLAANRAVGSADGAVQTAGFLVDMNILFQDFVAKYLEEKMPVRDHRLSVGSQEPNRLDRSGTGRHLDLIADLVIRGPDGPLAVLDTKYRDIDAGPVAASEVYQVVAYAHAFDVDKIALVYPSAEPQPRAYSLKGPGSLELRAFGVDLRFDPIQIERNCDRFVEQVASWIWG